MSNEINTDLRNRFAAAALAGGLEAGARDNMDGDWWHRPSVIAARAFAIADAMLVESRRSAKKSREAT